MKNPHDHLFKRIFSVPENAEGELRHLLPAAVNERIDWSTLTNLEVRFTDADPAQEADVAFSVQLDGREVLLYLLLEHQSTSDPWMPLRLLRYMLELWHGYLKKHEGATRLPAIVPMVVHHSPAGWTAPMQFAELLDLDAHGLQLLHHGIPNFRYLLDDLSHARSEELKQRVMTAIGRLTLLGLSRSRQKIDLLPQLQAWQDLIIEATEAPNGVAAMAALVRYILAVTETDPKRTHEFFGQLGPKEELAFMTGAEMLTEEVRVEAEARGEARGRAEGEARGEARGRAEMVLKLLALKFGALGEEEEARVRSSSVEELELYAERVLSATSLGAVLGE